MEELYAFMLKRENVRLRKEAGEPWPWTDDPILQRYKFTNVHREHDRTSRLLIDEFYSAHELDDLRTILFNCAIARYFGTIEFMRAVGWHYRFNPARIKALAKERLENKQRVFTGAYVITNQGISAPKYEVVVDRFLTPLWERLDELVEIADRTDSWKALIMEMMTLPGFGGSGFMAKEVVLDTTYTNFWEDNLPSDWNEWCPAGPGAQRGLRRLTGITDLATLKKPMRLEQALPMMLKIFHEHDRYWPSDLQPLCLHDIQFQLCEFDKYERVRLGQGKPRSRYRPCK